MKTTFISTQAVSSATRLSIMKMQAELAKNSKELGSGRWADVGLELGNKTGRTVSLRQDFARLDSIEDTNGLVSSRLDGSQAALEGVLKMAQDFSASLIGVRTGDTGADVIQDEAKNNLQALIASLNTSIDGEYLFAGIDTDVRPVTDYFATPITPGTGPKAAVDDAFLTAFGIAQNDPAAVNITPAAWSLPRRTVRGDVRSGRLERPRGRLVLGIRPECPQPHLDVRTGRHLGQLPTRRRSARSPWPTRWSSNSRRRT